MAVLTPAQPAPGSTACLRSSAARTIQKSAGHHHQQKRIQPAQAAPRRGLSVTRVSNHIVNIIGARLQSCTPPSSTPRKTAADDPLSPPPSPFDVSKLTTTRSTVATARSATNLVAYGSVFPRQYLGNNAAPEATSKIPNSPLLLLHALLIVNRLVDAHSRSPLPQELQDPAAMLLVGLMMAECHISDAQTSSAAWATLLGVSREHVVSIRRMGLLALNFDTGVGIRGYSTAELQFCQSFARLLASSC